MAEKQIDLEGMYVRKVAHKDPEPRCIKIDLDCNGYWFGGYRPLKAIIVRYEGKEYVARPSDLMDALVVSGLFKVMEHD